MQEVTVVVSIGMSQWQLELKGVQLSQACKTYLELGNSWKVAQIVHNF